MMPRHEDYAEINGKMHPNLSKNRNRKYPTIEKIKFTTVDI